MVATTFLSVCCTLLWYIHANDRLILNCANQLDRISQCTPWIARDLRTFGTSAQDMEICSDAWISTAEHDASRVCMFSEKLIWHANVSNWTRDQLRVMTISDPWGLLYEIWIEYVLISARSVFTPREVHAFSLSVMRGICERLPKKVVCDSKRVAP